MKATNQPHWFDVGDEWYSEAYDDLDIEDVPCPGPSQEQYVPITWRNIVEWTLVWLVVLLLSVGLIVGAFVLAMREIAR